MKKALIAGAASTVLAAMPVLGVFAADGDTLTDTFNLKINNTCAMVYGTLSDVTPTGAHGAATNVLDGSWTGNTYSADVLNNTTYSEFATTNFKITCNNEDGYQVTVAATDFTDTAESNGVDSTTYPWAYNVGGLNTTENAESNWTLASNHANQNLTTAGAETRNVVAKRTAPLAATGESFTITYSAYVDSGQPAATYKATATYTFAEL